MATFAALVEDTLSYLRGFVRDQELSTHLTTAIDADDTTLLLADPEVVSRGRVEIGDEILWVQSVDRSTDSAVVAPYGRGFDGTTAASHGVGSRVVVSPLFPRRKVKDAVNATIRATAVDLFAVAYTTITLSPATVNYALPAAATGVLRVEYDTPGPSGYDTPIRRWRFNRKPTSGGVPSLDVFDAFTPGRTAYVTYTKDVVALSADADDFTTVTGLPASCEDLVVYGAVARLAPLAEAVILNTGAVEANQLDGKIQPGYAQRMGQFYYSLHRQRVIEERARLLEDNPVSVHFTR